MADRAAPKNGGLLGVLTSWWVLLPVMAGLSAGAVAWALDQDQWAVVACALGALAALGAAGTRALLRPPGEDPEQARRRKELTDCLDALSAGQGRCQETPRTATPAPTET